MTEEIIARRVSLPEPLQWVVQCSTAGCPGWGRSWAVTLPDVGDGLITVPVLRCRMCGCEPVTIHPPRWDWDRPPR